MLGFFSLSILSNVSLTGFSRRCNITVFPDESLAVQLGVKPAKLSTVWDLKTATGRSQEMLLESISMHQRNNIE